MPDALRLDRDIVPCKEPLVARYLTMLADCRATTIDTIKSMRDALLYWRKSDFDSNISDLLYHIAIVEADWLFTDVLEQPIPSELVQHLPYSDRDSLGRLVHIGEEKLEESLMRLAQVRVRLNDTYATMDLKEFRRLRHGAQREVSPEWVLHHLAQHEAEHRGQMNLLKRLGTETLNRKA